MKFSPELTEIEMKDYFARKNEQSQNIILLEKQKSRKQIVYLSCKLAPK